MIKMIIKGRRPTMRHASRTHRVALDWLFDIIYLDPKILQIYGRSSTDALNDFDVNNAMWGICMNVTLQAAVHLGRGYVDNLRFTKNQLLKSVKQLFQVIERFIKDLTEISGLTTMDY